MGRKCVAVSERKIHLPSWSMKTKFIVAMEQLAEKQDRKPSAILEEIVEKYLENNK